MYLFRFIASLSVILLLGLLASCNLDDGVSTDAINQENSANNIDLLSLAKNSETVTNSLLNQSGFVHGIVVKIDGEDYYFAGAPDGPGGAIDVPGHYWVQAGSRQFVGKHYNTGPFGAPQWWSSNAPDGELLFIVHGIIDMWSEEKSDMYASRGYTHYHEFVKVSDGSHHPTKVVWLKHTARTTFNLDGGPRPDLGHQVTPGVDFEFMPNYNMLYDPD